MNGYDFLIVVRIGQLSRNTMTLRELFVKTRSYMKYTIILANTVSKLKHKNLILGSYQ